MYLLQKLCRKESECLDFNIFDSSKPFLMLKTDNQTLIDLQILPTSKSGVSVLGLFNKVSSYGGKDLLDVVFRHPLSSKEEILKQKVSQKS